MRCLYLQENLIKKIENIDHMKELRTLNLTDNMINRVSGLKGCDTLSTLLLKRNRIGYKGLDDLKDVLECPSISVLDV